VKVKMREKIVEQYLVGKVEGLGGKAFKFSSPNNRAVPDRMCIFPCSLIAFVECKATGEVPTPLQAKVIKFMRNLGQLVLVIDSKEGVNAFIDVTRTEMLRRKEIKP
jgi:hypothetical protein